MEHDYYNKVQHEAFWSLHDYRSDHHATTQLPLCIMQATTKTLWTLAIILRRLQKVSHSTHSALSGSTVLVLCRPKTQIAVHTPYTRVAEANAHIRSVRAITKRNAPGREKNPISHGKILSAQLSLRCTLLLFLFFWFQNSTHCSRPFRGK